MDDFVNINAHEQSSIDPTGADYFAHSSAPRVATDAVIFESLQRQYPDKHIQSCPQQRATFFCTLAPDMRL